MPYTHTLIYCITLATYSGGEFEELQFWILLPILQLSALLTYTKYSRVFLWKSNYVWMHSILQAYKQVCSYIWSYLQGFSHIENATLF